MSNQHDITKLVGCNSNNAVRGHLLLLRGELCGCGLGNASDDNADDDGIIQYLLER